MSQARHRINWFWIPTFLVSSLAAWLRDGPAYVALGLVLAVVLIVLARQGELRRRK
jgi:hypothetical protein